MPALILVSSPTWRPVVEQRVKALNPRGWLGILLGAQQRGKLAFGRVRMAALACQTTENRRHGISQGSKGTSVGLRRLKHEVAKFTNGGATFEILRGGCRGRARGVPDSASHDSHHLAWHTMVARERIAGRDAPLQVGSHLRAEQARLVTPDCLRGGGPRPRCCRLCARSTWRSSRRTAPTVQPGDKRTSSKDWAYYPFT